MKKKKPKILFFDLETTPNVSYTWGKWQQNVIDFKQEWELLSFAYKWDHEKKVKCYSRRHFKEEIDLVTKLYQIYNSADVVIAHNGDEFDIKKSKAKFVEYKLPPTNPVISRDTKKIAKKYFKFNSNSLNDLCKKLDIGAKIEHSGFDLWLGCIRGDRESLLKMEKYNKKDVYLLEKLYHRLKGWIQNQPGIAIHTKKTNCPNCNSSLCIKHGYRITKGKKKQKYQCQNCGSIFL